MANFVMVYIFERISSNGEVINPPLTIIMNFFVFLLFITCVRPSASLPVLKPTCDHLEPTPCTKVFSKDKAGKPDFRYYHEECSYHTCTRISPKKPPPPPPRADRLYWMPPLAMSEMVKDDEVKIEEDLRQKAAMYFTKITHANSGFQFSDSRFYNKSLDYQEKNIKNISARTSYPKSKPRTEEKITTKQMLYKRMSKYWDPNLVGVDSKGQFVRVNTDNFWFCAGAGAPVEDNLFESGKSGVDYDARVTTNSVRSFGLTEDLKAHCEFLRVMDLLYLTSCDLSRQSCPFDCLPAVRAFYCAMYLPMCKSAPGNIYGTGVNLANNKTQNVIYIANNMPSDVSINASYIIIKACRDLCWKVKRSCTRELLWSCHFKESRDFADQPDCNAVNTALLY